MEDLKKEAKEFCEVIDICELYRLTESREKPYDLLAKFAQSLIDKGVLMEAKSNDYIKELADDTKKLIVKLFPPLEFGEDPDVCELYESVEELEKLSIPVGNISDHPNSKDEIKALRILIGMVEEIYPETSDFIRDNLVEPIESPVSSAGKEVKTLQDDEIKMMTKQYRQSVESHAGATGFYAGAMKTKRWYDDQFKPFPASTVKVISDNDIFMQAAKLYPLGVGDGEDRESWIKGFKACREQLTAKP